MDISPIYELRTRLKTAMIAGTNLVQEDFRLKRAVEAIQPFLPLSPVFAKLGKLSQALLEPGQENQEGLLVDALSLVDAILCTQAAVAASGEIEPLIRESYGTAITNAPYSVIKTLMDALENSGNGRYSYVIDTHQAHPELFRDYRIQTALVRALGASYAELAEQVTQWLKEGGENIIPLLKGGFHPKGRKEMVRRVEILDAVAKEKENEFYLSQLPEAEKEVRQALIYVLRHSPENTQLLCEMAKSEKGNAKKMAHYALAAQPKKDAEEFFRKLMDKREDSAISFLEISDTEWASDITAKGFQKLLLPWTEDTGKIAPTKEQQELITLYLRALPFKRGEAVRQCYRLAFACGEQVADHQGEKWILDMKGLVEKNTVFPRTIPQVLSMAIMLHPDPEMCELAGELYMEAQGTWKQEEYLKPVLIAKLVTEENSCAWLKEQMEKGLAVKDCLEEVLKTLDWSPERGAYVIENDWTNPVDGKRYDIVQELKQKIAEEFIEVLMGLDSISLDYTLARCINAPDTTFHDRVLEYLYQRALRIPNNSNYCEILRENGWAKCEGLAVAHFRSNGAVGRWELSYFMDQMPGANREKAKEMRAVVEMLRNKKLKGSNITKEWLNQYEETLKYIEYGSTSQSDSI